MFLHFLISHIHQSGHVKSNFPITVFLLQKEVCCFSGFFIFHGHSCFISGDCSVSHLHVIDHFHHFIGVIVIHILHAHLHHAQHSFTVFCGVFFCFINILF